MLREKKKNKNKKKENSRNNKSEKSKGNRENKKNQAKNGAEKKRGEKKNRAMNSNALANNEKNYLKQMEKYENQLRKKGYFNIIPYSEKDMEKKFLEESDPDGYFLEKKDW